VTVFDIAFERARAAEAAAKEAFRAFQQEDRRLCAINPDFLHCWGTLARINAALEPLRKAGYAAEDEHHEWAADRDRIWDYYSRLLTPLPHSTGVRIGVAWTEEFWRGLNREIAAEDLA
jgi:hypothetical protein